MRSLCVPLLSALLCTASGVLAQDPSPLSFPSSPSSNKYVNSNFLGVSIELSIINTLIGETATSMPQPAMNLLSTLRQRMGDSTPLRLRIGGNSMDSSIYVQNQTNTMLTPISANANSNDISVYFGPLLFEVLKGFGHNIGGAEYVLGLSLRDPTSANVPLLASAAEQGLGDELDAFLLGNEPDLYTNHGDRPNLKNYTTDDYISEFGGMMNSLHNSQYGNLIQNRVLGGPTICCNWDLQNLLDAGYISNFTSNLKYISVQHYPQNQCGGTHAHGVDLYTQHQLVVSLAQWNGAGVQTAFSANLPVMMSEFNTASCGGIPGISDTFASTLWIVDYALQMASIGYAAAYIHTRERGVSYNLFDPPATPSNSTWKTLPSYYALLPVADALHSNSGNASVVYDLNIAGSTTTNGSLSGYAIYQDSKPKRLVLFNRPDGNSTTAAEYTLNSSTFQVPSGGKIGIKWLAAPSLMENVDISYGGQTYAGTGDGKSVTSNSSTGTTYSQTDLDCASGCTVKVPGPGLAVVWLDGTFPAAPTATAASASSTSNNSNNKNGAARALNGMRCWLLVLAGLVAGSLTVA